MSGFTKLFSSILTSTVWQQSKDVKILWVTLLALSDKDGFVDGTLPGLAHQAGLTLQETIDAMAVLEGPDPFSRSDACEGRRCERIQGGWFLVNYARYRAMQDSEERREYLRQKQAERRAAQRSTVVTTKPTVATVVATTELRYLFIVATTKGVRVGFGVNPWARISEIRRSYPGARLIRVSKVDADSEVSIRRDLEEYSIEGGWYRDCEQVTSVGSSLAQVEEPKSGSTTMVSTTSTQAEAEAEAEATKLTFLRKVSVPADADTSSPSAFPFSEDPEMDADEVQAMIAMRQEEAEGDPLPQAASAAPPRPLGADRPMIGVPGQSGGQSEAQADFGLSSEDDPKGKTFPWRQVMAITKRIVPEVIMPVNGDRRDHAMKAFWRKHGKAVSAFEVLAEKVRASDYLMARNGHVGNNGKPYSWGWIFSKSKRGVVRAEEILEDKYSNEAMAFVLERQKEAVLTEVVLVGTSKPTKVNMAELYEGEPRYKRVETHHSGLPLVLDYGG